MKLKKGVRRFLIFILILLIIALGGIIYYFGFYNQGVKEVKIIKEIPEYGYKLKENESGLYKKTFQDLEKVLSKDEVDEEKYVELLSKLFIIDFFSLDNKIAKTDVGGVEFVEESILDNFVVNAKDTYYKYVENDLYGKRHQTLPEVTKVEIESVDKKEYQYNDQTDSEAYHVKATWKYRHGKGYQDKATLIFVHKDKKLELVELK